MSSRFIARDPYFFPRIFLLDKVKCDIFFKIEAESPPPRSCFSTPTWFSGDERRKHISRNRPMEYSIPQITVHFLNMIAKL